MAAADEFTEFATGAAPRLRRTAFLLCGNWHTAEDLTQTTLAKMFVAWRRIKRQEAVYAYANRALVNTYLADRRGKRARELLASWVPERPVESPAPELRMVIVDALATLPPKARLGLGGIRGGVGVGQELHSGPPAASIADRAGSLRAGDGKDRQ